MVRIVKEYDERYAEFLQVAQVFFYTQGYEQTSVNEIINAVGVAKGTFYHYFDSKVDLLEALVENLIDGLYAQALDGLEPMLADDTISGVEKLQRFFAHVGGWKAANRDFVWESVRVFYQDENVLLRTKMMETATARIGPLVAKIIEQGAKEGTFDVTYPEEVAQVVFTMNQVFSDTVARMMLSEERDQEALGHLERQLETYERSVERVLGAPSHSLHLIDPSLLKIWFTENKN